MLAGVLAAATPVLAAVTGVVQDAGGKPIEGARVCHFEAGWEQLCAMTDVEGAFKLPSGDKKIRAVAEGYMPKTVPAEGNHVIVLAPAPELVVRLTDAADGRPIDRAEVFVVLASGAKKGPFPSNRAGVRVAHILRPGKIEVFAKADGYADSERQAVTLVAGEIAQLVLELTPKR